MALPELVLAITASTNFHIQVINRLSSGYPIWYLTVAEWTTTQASMPKKNQGRTLSAWVIRGAIVYAITQGALFANFLPPA